MGLMQRSLFQMTTSMDLRVSGSPTSRLFLKMVLSPFQILRSSPISSSTSERVLILSKSFSAMISWREGSELLALGMQLISLTGMKELSLLKMRLYLEQSFLLVWLQFSSRICPRDMRQMRLRWMRSWYSLALSPNMTPSIFMPALSTIVMLKILVNFPLLLLNSRYDFSMTLTTISHLPWKPMQRSLIFSNCFSSSSMISSASCESVMGSTGLRPLVSFFSVLYSTGGCLKLASFLMDGSANYQILVFGAIFQLRGTKSSISSMSFSFLVWVLNSLMLIQQRSQLSMRGQVSRMLSPGRVRQITALTVVAPSLMSRRRYSFLAFTLKAQTMYCAPQPLPYRNILLMASLESFIQVSNITPQFQIRVNLIESTHDRAIPNYIHTHCQREIDGVFIILVKALRLRWEGSLRFMYDAEKTPFLGLDGAF